MTDKSELVGMGGWLSLYVFLSTLTCGGYLFVTIITIFFNRLIIWDHMETYDMITFLVLGILYLLVIITISLKKGFAPKVVIFVESVAIAISILDFFVSVKRTDDLVGLFISVLISTAWILYFIKSKRVSNTFSGKIKEGIDMT